MCLDWWWIHALIPSREPELYRVNLRPHTKLTFMAAPAEISGNRLSSPKSLNFAHVSYRLCSKRRNKALSWRTPIRASSELPVKKPQAIYTASKLMDSSCMPGSSIWSIIRTRGFWKLCLLNDFIRRLCWPNLLYWLVWLLSPEYFTKRPRYWNLSLF